MSLQALLSIQGLSVAAADGRPILEDLTLDVSAGSILAIVGESGCGKTTLLNSLLMLLPASQVLRGGAVWLPVPGSMVESAKSTSYLNRERWLRHSAEQGFCINLLQAPAAVRRMLLGERIGLVPQEPMSALDPLMGMIESVAEIVHAHHVVSAAQAAERAVEALARAGLERQFILQRAGARPGQLSGGQRQRVLIAQAIVNKPAIVLFDEPTTALDPLSRNRVLGSIRSLVGDYMAAVIVTHDLASVQAVADAVCVLYLGRIVESGPVDEVFSRPQHPYTRALLACLPRIDRRQKITPINGRVPPGPWAITQGCKFCPRCPHANALCEQIAPELRSISGTQRVACHVAA